MAKQIIGKEVGYSCSYVPLEILDAFGLKANYVMKDPSSPDISQGYISQNICGFAKDICSRPRNQVFDMIFTDCCDAMVKVHEAFNLHPDFKDDFSYLLTVPRSYEKIDIEYWPNVLNHFIQTMEKATDKIFNDTMLSESIKKYNQLRKALRKAEKMLLQNRVWGSEYASLIFRLYDTGIDTSITIAEKFLETHKNDEEKDVDCTILVTGSNMPAALSTAEHIEENDGNVIFFDNCNLARFYNMDVPEDIDPLEALAKAYLTKSPCPRMKNSTARMTALIGLIDEYEIDLAVYHTLKFCATHIYDYMAFRELCKKNNIPLIRIETNHDFELPGQMATRIEAALEML